MPLYPDAKDRIRYNLTEISKDNRPGMCVIGRFTEKQLADINSERTNRGLHILESNEILFMGRHLYNSRSKDGYNIEDMILQISSSLSEYAVVVINDKMSGIRNPNPRDDGYTNLVNDQAVFEMTARKPKAELYSVVPKGDNVKPRTQKAHQR